MSLRLDAVFVAPSMIKGVCFVFLNSKVGANLNYILSIWVFAKLPGELVADAKDHNTPHVGWDHRAFLLAGKLPFSSMSLRFAIPQGGDLYICFATPLWRTNSLRAADAGTIREELPLPSLTSPATVIWWTRSSKIPPSRAHILADGCPPFLAITLTP